MAEIKAATLRIKSPAFGQGNLIPKKYTCEGDNIHPPFQIEDIPKGTQSLVIIMDDPDAPSGVFVHWLAWNINPVSADIAEGSNPGDTGTNSFRKNGYGGPCPPTGSHRYFFHFYALNDKLDLPPDSKRENLEQALEPYLIARGQLMGTYERENA